MKLSNTLHDVIKITKEKVCLWLLLKAYGMTQRQSVSTTPARRPAKVGASAQVREA
ncbi:hypothetical protein OE749_10630 [Aestuariibacter sp. AA17]|uniref:Transposase n=1 Tax=Fluctibacter corallii TaxID=2984329 RepID=A0ABT3A8Y7_9ALTE|nr:hypothetical protein [Aestuariibacter sp. AA17]MCV2885146.1 hypothetical protein [Aestuariibacter sp. AA17]